MTIRLGILGFVAAMPVTLLGVAGPPSQQQSAVELDPASGGTDHVGQPIPPYMTGDECLFCHRAIGTSWPKNRHQLTVRPAAPDDQSVQWLSRLVNGDEITRQADFVMGRRHVARALKRSSKYGTLELFEGRAASDTAEDIERATSNSVDQRDLSWNESHFGQRCAGCHCTAVEVESRAFSAISLDCYVCHGAVDLAHTSDVQKVLLSSKNQASKAVASICGQCHLRGGQSISTGLPYPNTFVPGDNLFRDFKVDLSPQRIAQSMPIERHILQNVRDIVVLGKDQINCLSCHDVHASRVAKHQELPASSVCGNCHESSHEPAALIEDYRELNKRGSHSTVCEY